MRYGHVPPPAGSISLIPAGSPVQVRVNEAKDQLHIFLAPDVLARVAADEFTSTRRDCRFPRLTPYTCCTSERR